MLLIVCTGLLVADLPELTEIRLMLEEGVEDKDKAEAYCDQFVDVSFEDEAIYQGFKGMGLMLQAKHAWNPYNKLKRFGEGKAWLENAIAVEPTNVELHHMRFCVQTNAPFFLNYHGEIDEDKEYMVEKIATVTDEDLRERIISYLIESGECTDDELQILSDARKGHTSRLGR